MNNPSAHDEHRSSGPKPVKLCLTSKYFSIYWFGPVNWNFHFEDYNQEKLSTLLTQAAQRRLNTTQKTKKDGSDDFSVEQ
jgi:hypothetical protein